MKSLSSVPAQLYLFLFIYSIVLFSLLDYQSLWVDEIMQVLGTRAGTLEHTGQLTQTGVGGVPLGWLPQLIAIRLFGYSTAIARLSSALAGVASCLTVYFTARKLGLLYPQIPAILLSVLPLHFRYALEGRPYAQGVLLSALATLVFIQLIERQSIPLFLAYTLILALGIYSQPFTCFTGCAHFVWTFTTSRGQRRLLFFSGGALVLTALTFLPWYLYAAPLWRETIQSGALHLQITWKTPLMLIREITGAGYPGGVVLLFLAIVGFHRGSITAAMKWLLVACAIVPAISVLAADAVFSYFLAIRQMIFVLPPLVILAASGLSYLTHSSPRKVVAAASLLTMFFAVADFGWMRKPREDWRLAATVIERLRSENSACTFYAPPSTLPYYNFFEPGLANSICPPGSLASGSVVLAISPYATEAERGDAQQILRDRHIVATQAVGMSTIELLR